MARNRPIVDTRAASVACLHRKMWQNCLIRLQIRSPHASVTVGICYRNLSVTRIVAAATLLTNCLNSEICFGQADPPCGNCVVSISTAHRGIAAGARFSGRATETIALKQFGNPSAPHQPSVAPTRPVAQTQSSAQFDRWSSNIWRRMVGATGIEPVTPAV